MHLRTLGLTLALLAGAGATAGAQGAASCTTPREACAFFDTFVSAFNRRDWPAFRATLAPDVSAFFDRPGPPMRQDGHEAVEAIFRLIFPDGPAPAEPPAFQIRPRHLQALDFGDVVIVSFELADAEVTGRRTLVLHRTPAGWRVAHIHGSSSGAPSR